LVRCAKTRNKLPTSVTSPPGGKTNDAEPVAGSCVTVGQHASLQADA
jgi:hypothetical protein